MSNNNENKKLYNACIISNTPMPDLTVLLNGSSPFNTYKYCSSLHEFLQSDDARTTDIAFLNVDVLSEEIMDSEVTDSTCCGSYIVAVGNTIDTNKVRNAMRAGARDYLLRPLEPQAIDDILKFAMGYVDARSSTLGTLDSCGKEILDDTPEKHGKVFSFFSPKDGAGKTTLLANFGIALSKTTGKSVCFVDFVPQFGDLTPMFDVKVRATLRDIIHLSHEHLLEDIQSFLTPISKNVSILAASPRPEDGELIRPHHVTTVIDALKTKFDYVIVDTPCSFSEVTLAAMDASKTIFMVLTPNVLFIRSLKSSIEIMEKSLKYEADRFTIVLNRVDEGPGIAQKNIESILGHRISHKIPGDGKAMMAAVNQGVPAVVENPKSKFARAVTRMAESEADLTGNTNGKAGKSSFFSVLKR